MKKIRVRDIRTLVTREPSVVHENDSLLKVAESIVEDPKTRAVYVLNKSNELVGIIPVVELVQYLYAEYIPQEYILYRFPILLSSKPTAMDIMLPPVYVHDEDDITDAFVKMFKNNLKELPVVDKDLHVIGDLNILELILAWIKSVKNAD